MVVKKERDPLELEKTLKADLQVQSTFKCEQQHAPAACAGAYSSSLTIASLYNVAHARRLIVDFMMTSLISHSKQARCVLFSSDASLRECNIL